MPEPVDAARWVNERIGKATVVDVDLREGTLDLQLRFDSGHLLQVLPESSGYEAWQSTIVTNEVQTITATGGGDLAFVRFDSSRLRPMQME